MKKYRLKFELTINDQTQCVKECTVETEFDKRVCHAARIAVDALDHLEVLAARNFPEEMTRDDYAIVAKQAFTLIRNIAHFRDAYFLGKKIKISHSEAMERLAVVGKIGEALHNMPVLSDEDKILHGLVAAQLIELFQQFPYLRQHIQHYRLPDELEADIKARKFDRRIW